MTLHPDELAIAPLNGEFADPRSESAYLDHHLARTRSQLAFGLLFCTLYFLAFYATDLASLGLVADTGLLLGARLAMAATAGTCAWLAWRRPLSHRATRLAASLSEAVTMACFMVIAVHRPDEFHWHAMSMAAMLLVIYLYIPNRLAYALGLAAGSTAVFLALTLAHAPMSFADLLTMGMLLALVNTVGALAGRRANLAARAEFRTQARLRHAATRDHQTGCLNRRYLHETLLGTDSPLPAGQPLAVILCDVDGLRHVNAAQGQSAGDAVLHGLAGLLRAVEREGIDSVVRYGGEEFLLVLPGTGLEAARELAEWLRTRLCALPPGLPAPMAARQGGKGVTASFGVAATPGGVPLDALIDMADKLMCTAKRNGRDRVEALLLERAGPVPDLPAAA